MLTPNRWREVLETGETGEKSSLDRLQQWERDRWRELATEEYKTEKKLAVQAWQARRCEDAIGHLTSSIAAHGQSEVLHRFRSMLETKVGRYDDAAADANRAVELNPMAPQNYHYQAVAQQQLKNYGPAGSAYLTAMQLGMQEWRHATHPHPT